MSLAAPVIDSTVFRHIFSSEPMRQVFSDEHRVQCYRDIEVALARVQALLGLMPQQAADEIAAQCTLDSIDMAKLKSQTELIGYPVLPVVQQLAAACADDLGEYCHWGATTQDITDTATILQLQEALELVEDDVTAISGHLADRPPLPRYTMGGSQQFTTGGPDHVWLQGGYLARCHTSEHEGRQSQGILECVHRKRYTKAQGLFRTDDRAKPQFDDLLELDLGTIEPSLAGPRRPQDRVAMHDLGRVFREAFSERFKGEPEDNSTENALIRLGTEGGQANPDPVTLSGGQVTQKADRDKNMSEGSGQGYHGHGKDVLVTMGETQMHMTDGSVAIAAITSCTNTSNPSVMIAAGLLAKHAVERGLSVKPTVKTSLAPGSRAVIDYLNNAELLSYLEALRFHLVGFGCTTCIAEGTPVLLANGTARRIEQMAITGGAALLAPTADGRLSTATQAEMMVQGEREEEATLEPPAYSQSTIPEHVEALKQVMDGVTRLLARCGVKTNGANVYEYPTRRAASSYPAVQDGIPRVEVRLELPDGLSFVERVGFRYCMDKALRASAAAVYWHLVDQIHRQRLWMSARLAESRQAEYELSFSRARKIAAVELMEREAVVSPHYALLVGYDRFSRLPQPTARKFQPLHRDSCDFPLPVELFSKIGAREWFALLRSRADAETSKRYCIEKEERTLPTLALQVVERRPAGRRAVFDLAVNDQHAFVAGTVAVHNCIGNSGPLSDPVAEAVQDNDLLVAAVLSGNRNFEGRIHPQVRASFLASPPLVVAYALAGTVDIDLSKDPLGMDINGEAVYLNDVWPTQEEVRQVVAKAVTPEVFARNYASVFEGDEYWRSLPNASGELFAWDPDSTYIQEPPFFQGMSPEPEPVKDIRAARVLALLDDSITTDHISPAGNFSATSPAGRYLVEKGVEKRDFNTYGTRRGNHEVMVRGTFGNIRLHNRLAPEKEGYYTVHLPGGELTTINEASELYQQESVPLLIIAGKEYGSGSSRDWAAKGPLLLGVRAVIAESFERIHRSNLVGMGILPLQFKQGENKESLVLTGKEVYDIEGIEQGLKPRQEVSVKATRENGSSFTFSTMARLDSPIDVTYYEQGGILLAVLRRLLKAE